MVEASMSIAIDDLLDNGVPSAADWVRLRAELHRLAVAEERRRLELETALVNASSAVDELDQALGERDRRLAFALADTGTGLFEIRLATGQVTADDQALEMFGLDRSCGERLSIEDIRTRLHPHDHAIFNQIARRLLGAERVIDLKFRIVAPDGTYRHVGGRAAVERTPKGRPERIMGVVHDVSRLVAEEVERQQSQKLESIGQLAAGIAHEINTPVQFVADSIGFVAEAGTDLLGLIEQLLDLADDVAEGRGTAGEAVSCLERAGAIDIEFLAAELPRAVSRAVSGLDRVAGIVRSMKDFAHPDGREMTPTDINRGVESTLTIARTEYKYVADLHTEFGELPPVLCHPGAVNQAVLNIVVNAAHAIADRVAGTADRGLISVVTRRDGDDVVIEISDTGGGVPAEIRHRIFDPFFTTKEVGRGTGQGLAISRAAIEEHHGSLTFDVQDAVGTTFVVRIPIDPRRTGSPGRRHQEVPS